MKNFVIGLIAASGLTYASQTLAGPHHGHRHHHYQHRHWAPPVHHWVVPALIGGAVVYAATRPDPVVVQPAPVIVNPPIQNTQYVIIDGITYQRQVMMVNGVAQEVLVRVQ